MTVEATPLGGFEFLSPLDGKKYVLPKFDQTKYVDRLTEHLDTLPPLPSFYEALSGNDPHALKKALTERQEAIGTLNLMTLVSTFNEHLPDRTNPAQSAIVALIEATEFKFLFKLFREWRQASGEEVENPEGEG